jgi:hypothetical protein
MYIVHRDGPTAVKPEKATQLALLYRHNEELVRAPRSYRDERPRQALRWLATMLKDVLGNTSEVQAYFDSDENTLYVSSNHTALNEQLATLLARGSRFEKVLRGRAAPIRDKAGTGTTCASCCAHPSATGRTRSTRASLR